MPAPTRLLAALIVLAAAPLAPPARADPRLDVAATTCERNAAHLERRLANILDEAPSRELTATVTFEASGEGVRVAVVTHDGSNARGETLFVVANCEEALDAAVVVLSLAFSTEANRETLKTETPPSEPSVEASPVAETPTFQMRFAAPLPERDASPASHGSDPVSPSSAVSLAGGLDFGTLATPTAIIGGGFTRAWPALEVRAALRYGLPTENERAETTLTESVRRDFGAAELSLCRGFGTALSLTACAGGEVGLVRVLHRVEVDGAPALDEDELSPRFSGVLAALVSLKRGPVRPELEVSASALAFGRRGGGSAVALRAAAGAAVDF